MRSSVPSAVAKFLATVPEAERPRFEALADAILEAVGEQLADLVEKAVEAAAASAR